MLSSTPTLRVWGAVPHSVSKYELPEERPVLLWVLCAFIPASGKKDGMPPLSAQCALATGGPHQSMADPGPCGCAQ